MAENRTITIECMRYNPETDSEPRFQSYDVPFTDDMSVLQGLQYIKDHLDGTLTFRWSCRMAICGSCGMMINGEPQAVVPDLPARPLSGPGQASRRSRTSRSSATWRSSERLRHQARAASSPTDPEGAAHRRREGEYLQTPEQARALSSSSAPCINCMLCYARLPAVRA